MLFIASLSLLAENPLRKTLLTLALSRNKLKTKGFPHHTDSLNAS